LKEFISLAAVGDVCLAGLQGDALDKVIPILRDHDIRFGNLEGPVSDRGKAREKLVAIRTEVGAMATIKKAGFDVMSFANNHCTDFGADAFLHTLQLMDEHGIAYVGAGRHISEAMRPIFIEKQGCRIAFLAYASFYDTGISEATETQPGLVPVRIHLQWNPPEIKALGHDRFLQQLMGSISSNITTSIDELDLCNMITSIKQAKEQSDILLVSHHWGTSQQHMPMEYQNILAHHTIDAGADIVIGHHPHVLQGMEIYKGKVICYSRGNFVFGVKVPFFVDATKDTVIVTCLIKNRQIKSVYLQPVAADQYKNPTLLTSGTLPFEKISTLVCKLSASLGTVLRPVEDKIWILDERSVKES